MQSLDKTETDAELGGDAKPRKPLQVKKKALLPWWTAIIAWLIIVIGCIACAIFTTFYGIMFGDLACRKWLSSMFISFFASVALTQPIKVICVAIFFSLMCKTEDAIEEEDLIEEEEEVVNEIGKRNGLLKDEEWLHKDQCE